MRFQRFQDFLKSREVDESTNSKLNRPALNYDKKLAEFNARFSDPGEGDSVVKAAGYKSVAEFLSDTSDKKWARLKIPGQENYVK